MIPRRRFFFLPSFSAGNNEVLHLSSISSSKRLLPTQKMILLVLSLCTLFVICNRSFQVKEVTRFIVASRASSFWDLDTPDLFSTAITPQIVSIGDRTLPGSLFNDLCTVSVVSSGDLCPNTTARNLEVDIIWNWDPSWK